MSLPIATSAFKGDFLIEGGPLVSGRSIPQLNQPGIGVSAGVLSSLTEHADLGITGSYEHQNGEMGGLDLATIGIQSWFGGIRSKVRPQLGTQLGLALTDELSASLHLGAQARAIFDLPYLARLYLGAAFGGNIGERSSTYRRGEFGTQFRFD
ncbi:MAG TPA: hypothetical protein PKO15_04075 [Fibrobacteria bacterium]|nr:hypothetical protein [Fibrobacteria bacterium]HOX53583.1 hypothetical protein [Fibrobacteria bacterium]